MESSATLWCKYRVAVCAQRRKVCVRDTQSPNRALRQLVRTAQQVQNACQQSSCDETNKRTREQGNTADVRRTRSGRASERTNEIPKWRERNFARTKTNFLHCITTTITPLPKTTITVVYNTCYYCSSLALSPIILPTTTTTEELLLSREALRQAYANTDSTLFYSTQSHRRWQSKTSDNHLIL